MHSDPPCAPQSTRTSCRATPRDADERSPTRMADALLEIENLHTFFYGEAGVSRAVDGVTFSVDSGEIIGLVGESGSGKSVTALSILRLVRPPGRIEAGSRMLFEGRDLVALSERELRAIRGARIAMVFQEPM